MRFQKPYLAFPVSWIPFENLNNAFGLNEMYIYPHGEGNGNPLHYSRLENPIDRGTWQATVHGVTKESDMFRQLNNNNK